MARCSRGPSRMPSADCWLALRERGVESLAICLLHGYAHPEHEDLVETIAREVGFRHVSTSHRVAPLVKIVSRGDTTVMDAYLNPVLQDYVARLQQALGSGELRIMTSAGGLVAAGQFVGKDSILSGPAGGVVGFSRAARARRLRAGHRLRHGRHQHRRRPLSTAATSWNTKPKRRACASWRR